MSCSRKHSMQLLGCSQEKTNFWYVSNCTSSTKDEICRVRRMFYSTHWVHCVCLTWVCVSVCRCACESWIICGVHPLHKCSFQGFGKSPCTGDKKLQRSDPALADISQNIVEHSGHKKLPSYGNSCMLKPHWQIQRQSSPSLWLLSTSLLPHLHILLLCAQSFISSLWLPFNTFHTPFLVK